MSDDDEPPTTKKCEIHVAQPVFVHWGKYYCPQCKRWHDLKDG